MADRFFDFAARKTYQETFDKPKDSVHRALNAFSIIGTIMSIPRALLFIRALSHVYIGDDVGVFRCQCIFFCCHAGGVRSFPLSRSLQSYTLISVLSRVARLSSYKPSKSSVVFRL